MSGGPKLSNDPQEQKQSQEQSQEQSTGGDNLVNSNSAVAAVLEANAELKNDENENAYPYVLPVAAQMPKNNLGPAENKPYALPAGAQEPEDVPYALPAATQKKQAEKNATALRSTPLAKALTKYKTLPEKVSADNGEDPEATKKLHKDQKQEERIKKANEAPNKIDAGLNKVSAVAGATSAGISTASNVLNVGATSAIIDKEKNKDDPNVKKVQKAASIGTSISAIITTLLGMKKIYDTFKASSKTSASPMVKKLFTVVPPFLLLATDIIGSICSVIGTLDTFGHNTETNSQILNNTKNINTLAKQSVAALTSFAGAMMYRSKISRLNESTKGADITDPRTIALTKLKEKSAAAKKNDWIDFGKMIASVITQATQTAFSWKDKSSRGARIASVANGVMGTVVGSYNTYKSGTGAAKMLAGAKAPKKAAENQDAEAAPAAEAAEAAPKTPFTMISDKIKTLSTTSFVGTDDSSYSTNFANVTLNTATERVKTSPEIMKDYDFIDAYLTGSDADINEIAEKSPSKAAFDGLIQLAVGK